MVKLRRRRRSPAASTTTGDAQVSGPVDTISGPAGTGATEVGSTRRGGVLRLLLRAAHPRHAVALAVVLGVAAAASGRAPREVLLVVATVLVGQTILGWHNDLVDRGRDAEHHVADKPVAEGRLEPGTVWFAMACAVLVLIPLSVTNGVTAGSAYLIAVLVGILGNVILRQGALSWVTWAISYALLPAFLSYGGFGGQSQGDPPRVLITVLFALLGIGVHLIGSVWGLVPDDAAGWRTLPLRLGHRVGSSKLLVVSAAYLVVVLLALALAASTGGLSQ